MKAREKIRQLIADVIDMADWHAYPRRRAITRDAVALYLWFKGHGMDAKGMLIDRVVEEFENNHLHWSEKALELARKRVIPIVVSIMQELVKDMPYDDVVFLGSKAKAFLK